MLMKSLEANDNLILGVCGFVGTDTNKVVDS